MVHTVLSSQKTRRARRERDAEHSRRAGGRSNKPGNVQTRLIPDGRRTSRSPQPPYRILKMYMEVLMGFSNVHSLDGLHKTSLSQGCVLETSGHDNCGQNIHSKDKGGSEQPLLVQYLGPACKSNNWQSSPLSDLIQHVPLELSFKTEVA